MERGSEPFRTRYLAPKNWIIFDALKKNPPIFVCIVQECIHHGEISQRVFVL